jgi:hypothetical protein
LGRNGTKILAKRVRRASCVQKEEKEVVELLKKGGVEQKS